MKIKSIIWAIVILMTGVVVFQNSDTFFRTVPIGLNLVLFRFDLEGLPVVVIVIGFFLFGYLVSLLTGVAERHRLKVAVDTLKDVVATQSGTMQRDVTRHDSTLNTEPANHSKAVEESANMAVYQP